MVFRSKSSLRKETYATGATTETDPFSTYVGDLDLHPLVGTVNVVEGKVEDDESDDDEFVVGKFPLHVDYRQSFISVVEHFNKYRERVTNSCESKIPVSNAMSSLVNSVFMLVSTIIENQQEKEISIGWSQLTTSLEQLDVLLNIYGLSGKSVGATNSRKMLQTFHNLVSHLGVMLNPESDIPMLCHRVSIELNLLLGGYAIALTTLLMDIHRENK
jgi:hypothetical protein